MVFMSATLRCAESTIPLPAPTVVCMASESFTISACIWVIEAIMPPMSSDILLMSPTRSLRNCRFWVIGTEDMLIW